MMKTLEQINQEFFSEFTTSNDDLNCPDEFDPSSLYSLEDIQESIGITPSLVTETPSRLLIKRLSDILFYVVIVIILIITLVFGGKTHDAFHMLGYSGFTVLSGSMQREIPEGSLVITKSVDPQTIKIGDDITFIRDDNITVTHRVISILEDYNGSGDRGFQTQGLENPDPDRDIVYAGNIIGLVKFSIPELGFILGYASENIGLLFAILGGILIAAIALSRAFSKSEDDYKDNLDAGKAA